MVATGNVTMTRIRRAGVRLAIVAAIGAGTVDLLGACTVVTNNCNVKDACPASPPAAAPAGPASLSVPKP